MLTALEEGVQGGKWFSLIDKVYEPGTLRLSFGNVKENNGAAGEDHQTIEMFEDHLEENLSRLAEELKSGRYRPRAIRRKYIPKPGSQEKRPLGIPTVRDRVVQGAIKMALEPIFERDFHEESYGFRPGRGCKDALRRVNGLLQEGYTWVVDADLKSYFDTIPHDRLLQRVADKVSDGRILELVEAFLKQPVMESMKSWTPESGTPQGAVLSPLLSNMYLDPLDHYLARKEVAMVRYADDFVILCRNKQEAMEALEMVKEWTAGNGLTLHPEKTHVVDATQKGGFDFLGYHFERGYRWPRKKSLHKFKDTVRGKTKRNNGHSLQKILLDVSATLAGWFEYFKHSHRTTFEPLDQWIRMRLRSILRKRQGGKGRGRGSDHQRWPNAFFAKSGLFSLTAAHEAARQSSRR
ncbi:MAG: group II intron reverse transcriptase/maturase [Desulfomonile tiedjei]|nr:group II intron reverse transcriptase/maturase [Desulfomonile tiedjei]